MALITLVRRNPRELGFGFFHALASSAGQTFVISLFLPGIKGSFALGDAQVASLYAVATVASAAVLWTVGRWIDRVDLLHYSLVSGLFLAFACFFTASATWVPMLALGFFALRLGGQGLMTHVAVTAVARYFSKDRGKALSLTSMGHPLGEAALPVIVVMLIGAWGWRPAMAAAGGFALLLVMSADVMVRGNPAFRKPRGPVVPTAHSAGNLQPTMTSHHFLYSRYFLMSAPLFIATPLIVTALIFHQAVIAREKGFSLEWFAVSFIAYAVARVAGSLLMGPVVDRVGTSKIFSFHVLPFCLGIAILAAGSQAWVVPVYWVLAGITGGMAGTLQAAIIAEHVASDRLGTVRSILAAMTILASAAGPVLYARLAGSGLTMSGLLWGTVAAMLTATLMSAVAGYAWPLKPHEGRN